MQMKLLWTTGEDERAHWWNELHNHCSSNRVFVGAEHIQLSRRSINIWFPSKRHSVSWECKLLTACVLLYLLWLKCILHMGSLVSGTSFQMQRHLSVAHTNVLHLSCAPPDVIQVCQSISGIFCLLQTHGTCVVHNLAWVLMQSHHQTYQCFVTWRNGSRKESSWLRQRLFNMSLELVQVLGTVQYSNRCWC